MEGKERRGMRYKEEETIVIYSFTCTSTAGKYHFFPTLVSATPYSFRHKNSISLCRASLSALVASFKLDFRASLSLSFPLSPFLLSFEHHRLSAIKRFGNSFPLILFRRVPMQNCYTWFRIRT